MVCTNRDSTHFVKHETKSMLVGSKRKIKRVRKLKINYKNVQITQHTKVTYLGCILDESMSGAPMALKIINELDLRHKFK